MLSVIQLAAFAGVGYDLGRPDSVPAVWPGGARAGTGRRLHPGRRRGGVGAQPDPGPGTPAGARGAAEVLPAAGLFPQGGGRAGGRGPARARLPGDRPGRGVRADGGANREAAPGVRPGQDEGHLRPGPCAGGCRAGHPQGGPGQGQPGRPDQRRAGGTGPGAVRTARVHHTGRDGRHGPRRGEHRFYQRSPGGSAPWRVCGWAGCTWWTRSRGAANSTG